MTIKNRREALTQLQAEVDVVIIGGGQAALATAYFLGYTDLMVDGAPSPHQSDTTLRWLIDRLRS
ncbi:hypothetical protein HPJ33_02270 [Acinetobacter baumannii]|nr:hypothetical protein [Acinetobacter baumannii]